MSEKLIAVEDLTDDDLMLVDDSDKEEEIEPAKERFKVTDLASADWCFKKLQEIEKERQKQKDYVDEMIFIYKNHLEKEEERLNRGKEYFEGLLKEYVDKERFNNPKFKLKTALGSASYGQQQKKWNYKDEKKVIKELHDLERTDLIKTTESLNKSAIKKAFKVTDDNVVVTENGEIVDGIEVIDFTNFNVKY